MSGVIIVTVAENGVLEAITQGSVGAAVCGRGATVLEAVGDYAIQSGLLKIRCEPAALVDTKYQVSRKVNRAKLVTEGCDRRD
jgi:hypothetical protein